MESCEDLGSVGRPPMTESHHQAPPPPTQNAHDHEHGQGAKCWYTTTRERRFSYVEYSSAITTIVINGSLSSLDANPSNPSRNPVDDPMTVTHAMTAAKQLACGLATNTVTVDGSNTHEMMSWGCKDRTLVTTATISSDHEESTAGSTKETLVVDHNKREETGIS
jgi:hypothetical protein